MATVNDVIEKLVTVLSDYNHNFTLNEQPLNQQLLLEHEEIMQALLRQADQLAEFCSGTGLGLSFEQDLRTQTGAKVELTKNASVSKIILHCLEVLQEVIDTNRDKSSIALEQILQKHK